MSAIYNFNDLIDEDTLEQRLFSVKRYVNNSLVDLTGATVRFQVFRSSTSHFYIDKDSDAKGGVTIINTAECIVQINEIINHGLTPALYYWRLVVDYPDGDVKTYLGGKFNVKTIKQLADV